LFFVFAIARVPIGLFMILIVGGLVLRRAGPWWRHEPAPLLVTSGA
jgi:hypothetical protein